MRPWHFLRFFLVLATTAVLVVSTMAGCGRTSLEPEDFLLADGGTSSSSSGGPTSCGPSNCSTGCCDASGKCQTGHDATACGALGGTCSNCTANGFTACNTARACVKAVATCNASTCPTGCCQSDGAGGVQCAQGTSSAACGTSGQSCLDCENSGSACDIVQQHCSASKCDASNCTGCCVGDQCLPGNSSFACGANGGQCGSCDPGQVCQLTSAGGGVCIGAFTCGPDNCDGCCNPDGQCVGGIVDAACGFGGQRCTACPFEEACSQFGDPSGPGTCQPLIPSCDIDSCSNGCCAGNTCVPFAAGTNLCGQPGTQCTACAANEKCDTTSFTCEATCNPTTCKGGCCVNDICAVGSQNTACGSGGAQCQNCTNLGDVCTANACVPASPKCTAANCPNGCCQNDTCVGGISNDACGTGGVACSNCNADGAFCDGLVTPRTCSDNQTTCPAPYASCAAGTTTPVQKTAQNVCTTQELDAAKIACADPTSNLCQQAIAVAGACGTCIAPFAHPFSESTGLYACAASFVTNTCRHSLGCATDCASTSCSSCTATATPQCYTLVDQNNGQCASFAQATTCADASLAAGQFCSQFSYADFGTWLRAVGAHFCGAGP